MALTLKEVKNTKDLRKFIRFPLDLYRNHPYYVPSLFPDEMNTLHWEKNPRLSIVKPATGLPVTTADRWPGRGDPQP